MDKSAQRYIDLAFEYHVAAMTLNSQIFDAPYLYNPTAYLLRHTIELLLKGLIINEEKRKHHISIKKIKYRSFISTCTFFPRAKSVPPVYKHRYRSITDKSKEKGA